MVDNNEEYQNDEKEVQHEEIKEVEEQVQDEVTIEKQDEVNEPSATKLSLEKIEEYEKAVKDSERVEFSIEYDGKEELVYITVDKTFTRTNIVACVQEYIRNIDKLRKKRVDIESGFLEMYLIFMMIKHFTDLDMPSQIEKQLIVMERLINTNLIFYIFMEFPHEEINNLMKELDELSELFESQLDNLDEYLKGMDLTKLENEEVINLTRSE